MKKRLISFLLAVSMMLSVLPVGAVAAVIKDIDDLEISASTGKPTTSSGEGWTYDEATDTLTIKEGFDWADYNFNYKSHPVITCKVVNYGVLHGAVYTNTVTNYGRIVYGIYKQMPTDTGTTNYKEYYTISSNGTAFGLNNKLFNITTAYSVDQQAIIVNAPAGKLVGTINGTTYNSDNVSYTVTGDVYIIFIDDPGYSGPVNKIPLSIDSDGTPVNSNGGKDEVLNGDGWSYQKTTLDNGENEMTLVIDKGTIANLDGKIVRVPVKCAGILNGGTYTQPVEFVTSTTGSTGVFLNEVTLNGQAPADLKELFVMPEIDGFTFNGEISTFTNLERVYILGDPVITVSIPDSMQKAFRYWESAIFENPIDPDYSHKVFVTDYHNSEVQVQLGPYTRVRLWAVRNYSVKVTNGSAYTLANDGTTQVPVTEDTYLNYGTTVYLKLDDSFDRDTFDSWTAERLSGYSVDITNAADPDKAYFTIKDDTTVSVKTKAPVVKKGFTSSMFTPTVDGKALSEEFTAGTPHEIYVSANDAASDFHITQFSYYTYNETTGQYENRKAVDIDDNSTWPVNVGKYKIAIAVYDSDGVYNSTSELTDDNWVFEIKASTPSTPHTPVAEDFDYKAPLLDTDKVDDLANRLLENITAKNGIDKKDVTLILCDKDGNELTDAPTEVGDYTFKLSVNAAANGSYTATEEPLTSDNWKFTIHIASYGLHVTGGYAYRLNDDGSKHYLSSELDIYPGTKIYLELDKDHANNPDFVFKGWQVAEDSTPLEEDAEHNLTLKEGSYFIMPHGNVKLTLITSTTPVDPIDPVDPVDPIVPSEGGDGTGVALVLGGAAIGGAAYLIGTEIYLNNVFGYVPANRQQLAVALWNKAGNPEPVSIVLFTDISAEAVNDQKAARWCVEQGLLKDHGETFQPGNYIFRPQAIKAWNDLQAKLNSAE